MKIIDRYIIRKYLTTFFVMLLLFIPIGVMVDIAEKIDKFREKEVPFNEIINYYLDFTWHFVNILYPVFLFLSVIWFTSKLASNTEVIAVLGSGISFSRFLKPYLISSSIVFGFSFIAGSFIIPKSNLGYNEFRYKYINKKKERNTSDVFQQINENEFIYVSNYDPKRKRANNFTLEHFDGNKMKFKIKAKTIRWIERDSIFRLSNYSKRSFVFNKEIYEKKSRKDTLLDFSIDDLAPVTYLAETLTFVDLNKFISKEKERGSNLINEHLLVRHKRWSTPFSVFILTIIAVSVSSFKRRGGIGINLAFGVSLGFIFVFFDKIFGVLVAKSTFSPFLAAWLPLIIFGFLGYFLLKYARQ